MRLWPWQWPHRRAYRLLDAADASAEQYRAEIAAARQRLIVQARTRPSGSS